MEYFLLIGIEACFARGFCGIALFSSFLGGLSAATGFSGDALGFTLFLAGELDEVAVIELRGLTGVGLFWLDCSD
jgi:hypothetical protein